MIMRAMVLAIFMQTMAIDESLAKRRLCGEPLFRHLMRVCTFGYETTPCFKSPFAKVITTTKTTTAASKSLSRRTFSGIANKCCEEGCTVLDLRATCCFKLSCLKRCYPESNYEKRIKNVTAVKLV